ncbi:MAG: VPLPA-CTERM sorting domain-containing protein [Pseudomonadota bacterium]
MKNLFAAMAFTIGLTAPAFSATIVTTHAYSQQNYMNLFNAMGKTVVENFESFVLTPSLNGEPGAFQDQPIKTAVGEFYRESGTGSGGTVTRPNPDLDGTQLAVRNGNVFGRSDTTADLFPDLRIRNGQYLDSNDVIDMSWNVNLGGAKFKRLIFVLSDATDVGSSLNIIAGDDKFTYTIPGREYGDGERRIVKIDFGQSVDTAQVAFENSKRNDGLSIDDIAINVVPLPASVLFLGAGIAGLGLMRRRQKKT